MIILTAIGYILLTILMCVLFILALILFCPFRFYVSGTNFENEEVLMNFSWLFRLINFEFCYKNEKSKFNYFVFGFNNKNKNKKVKKRKLKKVKNKSEIKPTETVNKDMKGKKEKVNFDKKDDNAVKNHKKYDGKEKKRENKDKKEKTENWYNKLKNKNNKDNIIVNYLKLFYEYPWRKEFIGKLRRKLKSILKAFKFKIFKVNVKFGFDDPSLTGCVLGAVSALEVFIPINLNIDTDFEESVLKGDLELKVSIRLWRMIYPVMSIVIFEYFKIKKYIKSKR